MVRDRIGPVAVFKLAITVPRLPKTRSGKILRGTMKKIADGEPWTMPATIDDPKVLDEIARRAEGQGVRVLECAAVFGDPHAEERDSSRLEDEARSPSRASLMRSKTPARRGSSP